MIDPNLIDPQEIQDQLEGFAARVQDRRDQEQAEEASLLQEENNEDEESDVNVVDEVKRGTVGGLALSASSLLSFPERMVDMATGRLGEEIQETGEAQTDFDPLGVIGYLEDVEKNNLTNTWWAELLKQGVHYGSLGVTGGAVGIGRGLTGLAAKGLALDVAGDLVSKQSQEDTATQAITDSKLLERIPWAGEFLQDGFDATVSKALGTSETEHPFFKTLKNMAEGVGLTLAISKVLSKLPDGKKIDADRLKNRDDQLKESATAEIADDARVRESNAQQLEIEGLDPTEVPSAGQPGNTFRASKNKDYADPWQGNPVSSKKPFDVAQQSDNLGRSWPTPGAGSTDNVFTSRQLETMARSVDVTETEFRRMAKTLVSDDRYQQMLKDTKAAGASMRTTYGAAFDRVREAMGRDYSDMDPDTFWSVMSRDTDTVAGLDMWSSEAIYAADIINASLFKQVRDLGIGMREISGVADILDTDGPMKAAADRLIVGLTNVKRSRYLSGAKQQSLNFKGNLAKQTEIKKQAVEKVEAMRSESEEALTTFLKLAKENPNDDMTKALSEFFAMSDDVHNLTDFDAYMRASLRGGKFNGKKYSNQAVRELGSVMVHSILSGVKTPVRAIMGTATASFLRPLSAVIGASMPGGDRALARASLAGANAYIQAVPEAFQLFRRNLSAYWAGDIANMKTRFTEGVTRNDQQWAIMGKWAETHGTEMDLTAYRFTDMIRTLNDKNFLTYGTKIMGATDDAFTMLMARARAREKSMLDSMESFKKGDIAEITPETLKVAENNFYSKLLDEDGNINLKSDLYLESQVKEATLTTELSGVAQKLEGLFNSAPMLKPFFLFARTGINGLEFGVKHMPILEKLSKEYRNIASATVDNLDSVRQYGIESAQDLINAQNIRKGRLAIGSGVTFMASMYYANGGLTGNGPQDRRLRKLWMDTGWQPRSFKVPSPAGDVWVSYESFEPFNNILSTIADIGDNMSLMGPQWAEQSLLKVALTVGGGVTSKSYLQGVGQLIDLASGEPYQLQKIAGNIVNNTIPLAGLRNDIGKTLNSPMREINKDIISSIRNRNLASEYIAADDLAIKYDVLNGEKIRDWNFMEKMYNLISPVGISLNNSPGRTLLWNSNYDLRLVSYTSPDGLELKEHPKLRSEFQKYLGKQGLEAKLNKLADRRDVQLSVMRMTNDRNSNKNYLDPMNSYLHNSLIKQRFEAARKKAWAAVRRNNPDLTDELYETKKQRAAETFRTRRDTNNAGSLKSIRKINNPN